MSAGRGRASAALGLWLLLSAACGGGGGSSSSDGAAADPLAEARGELAAGRYDDVIARLGGAEDPDAAYLAGQAWSGKARSAPVPTPEPGAPAGATRMKPEEQRALAEYERAVAARPDFVAAQLAIAELLSPHALQAVAAAPRTRPGAPPPAPDPLVERVLRSYADALQADLAGTTAAEGLIDFATRAGRIGEADAAFQELVRRRREDPTLLVRYGDFLAGPAGKPEAALAQYAQALIWNPGDTATKLKMADIHLAAAAAHLKDLQYVAAEARLKDARRFAVDPASPQAARLAELEGRLREVRGR